jgi:hypothetical protein
MLETALERGSETLRKLGQFVLSEVEAGVGVECGKLLLFEGRARRERRDMPVHVSVPLLAAEAENVKPLRWHDAAHGLADAMHDLLKLKILVGAEVAGDLLAMLARCHQHVAVESRIRIEKCDRGVVLVDDVVAKIGVPGDQLADEALSAKLLF